MSFKQYRDKHQKKQFRVWKEVMGNGSIGSK